MTFMRKDRENGISQDSTHSPSLIPGKGKGLLGFLFQIKRVGLFGYNKSSLVTQFEFTSLQMNLSTQ